MGWNGSGSGSTPQKPKVAAKKPSPIRGIVAGCLVCALAIGAYFAFFSGSEKPQTVKAAKERGRIKAVTPAPAPTNAAPAVTKPIDPKEDYDHTTMYRDAKGVLRYKSGQRAFDPTRRIGRELSPGRRVVSHFKYSIENEIAVILQSDPGERRLATPDYYGENYLEDFKNSMKEKIEIKDDDPQYVKDLKIAVREVKEDLAKRLANGEKLGDILSETSREAQRLADYKDQLNAEVRKIIKDGDGSFSDKEVEDLIGAANKMFEENGINPVDSDEFVRWNIRLSAKRQGADPEAAVAEYDRKQEQKNNNKEQEGATE